MNSLTPRKNPNRIKNTRRQKQAVFIQGGRPRNKAVSRDEVVNDRRGAVRLQVTLSEYRRLATQPGFPPCWTDTEGQPYRLVSNLDAYAETHGLVIQRDLFGEPK
jgi:hypothetical protein